MTSRPSGITTVLCDADGNLFPSEEPAFVASAHVTNAFLAELGIDETYDAEQLRLATTGKNFRTTAVDLARAHGRDVDAQVLQRWVERERREVSSHLATALRPDPDVLDPLRLLEKRFVLAAVSSSATPRLRACLAATELDELLPPERVFSAEDSLPVPTSKPDPAVYVHACTQLGIDPAAAVAVEDSVPGAQSAVAAGICTIGNLQFVQAGERPERRQQLVDAGVAVVVESWAQVDDLLP